jgi:hypothetical protein
LSDEIIDGFSFLETLPPEIANPTNLLGSLKALGFLANQKYSGELSSGTFLAHTICSLARFLFIGGKGVYISEIPPTRPGEYRLMSPGGEKFVNGV